MKQPYESIADICRDHLVDRKWLLAPSLSVGAQWVDDLARRGVACINLNVVTIDSLAREWAHPQLAEQGLTELPPGIDALLLRSAWDQLPVDGDLRRLDASAGVLRSLLQTLHDLRLHEITPDQLQQVQPSGNHQRRQELAQLLRSRGEQLQQYQLVDRADMLRLACEQLAVQQTAVQKTAGGWLLVPERVEVKGLEETFLQQFGDALRRVRSPLIAATPDARPPALTFVRAMGPVNELRGMLRRCSENAWPLDQVELLTPDVPATAERLLDLLPQSDGREPLSQLTFADGLPLGRSRPAIALLALQQWASSDFSVMELCRLLENNLVDSGPDWGFHLAHVLRRLGMKGGRQHYLPRLQREWERLTARHKEQLAQASAINEVDASASDGQTAQLEKRIARLESLRQLMEEILPLVERLQIPGPESFEALQTLLESFTLVRDQVDAAGRAALQAAIVQQQQWQQTLQLDVSATQWLPAYVMQASILQSGPAPGCLHVASLDRGGQTGRPVCFVTGLNDQRIPGPVRQDPALADDERQSLDGMLPTGSSRHSERMQRLQHVIQQQRGDVILSWSCQNPQDGSEMFPARLVHELARRSVGQSPQQWNAEALEELAGRPLSYIGDDLQQACSDDEACLALLLEGQSDVLETRFPWYGAASASPAGREFDAWHGNVAGSRSSRPVLDRPDHVYSASGLETLGRCPLAYFFSRRLLGFQEEEFDDDLDRWLDPAAFGRLVHELFQVFLDSLSPAERPEFDRHWPVLKALVVQLGRKYEQDYPPVTRSGYRQDLAKVARIARTFLREESHWYQTTGAAPRFFEATLGMTSHGDVKTPLDTTDAVPIVLPSGRRIFGRGQVDRIDHLGADRYSICDYKTGSAYGYEAADPFSGGRRLQSTFYLKMVQAVLRDKVASESAVVRFDYFFPGLRGDGLRLGWEVAQLEPGLAVIETLVQLDEDGLYPPTDDADDCRFCAYQRACGNVRQQAYHASRWYQTDPRLADLQEVRHEHSR